MAENKISIKLAVDTGEAGKLVAVMRELSDAEKQQKAETDRASRIRALQAQAREYEARRQIKIEEEIGNATKQVATIKAAIAARQTQVAEKLASLRQQLEANPSKAGVYYQALSFSVDSANAAINKLKRQLEETNRVFSNVSLKSGSFASFDKIAQDIQKKASEDRIAAFEAEKQAFANARAGEARIAEEHFRAEQARLRQIALDRTNAYDAQIGAMNSRFTRKNTAKMYQDLFGPVVEKDILEQQKKLQQEIIVQAEDFNTKIGEMNARITRKNTSKMYQNLFGPVVEKEILEQQEKLQRDLNAKIGAMNARSITKLTTPIPTSKLPNAGAVYQDLFGPLVEGQRTYNQLKEKGNALTEQNITNHKSLLVHIAEIIGLYRVLNSIINLTSAALLSIPRTGIQLEQTVASLSASFGSAGAAAKELQFLNDEAKRTGVAIGTLRENYASASASFLAAGESAETVRKIFSNLNTVTTTLHLNQQQTSSIYLALSQIFNKTKLQAEELTKQLSQTIPGVTNAQAKALGITVAELYDKMKKGAISAHDAVLALTGTLEQRFGGGAFLVASQGLNAELGRLSTNWTLLAENLYKLSEVGMKNLVKTASDVLGVLIKVTSSTSDLGRQITLIVKVLGGTLLVLLGNYAFKLAAATVATAALAQGQTALSLATNIARNSTTAFLDTLASNKWAVAITAMAAIVSYVKGLKDEVQNMEDQITKTLQKFTAYTTGNKAAYDIENNPEVKALDDQILWQEKKIENLRQQAKALLTLPANNAMAAEAVDKALNKVNITIEENLAVLKVLNAAYAEEYAKLINGPEQPTQDNSAIKAIIQQTEEAIENADPSRGEKAKTRFLKGVKDLIPALQAEIDKQGPEAEKARIALQNLYDTATKLQLKENASVKADKDAKDLQKRMSLAQQATKSSLREQENDYNNNLKSTEDYFKAKAEIILRETESLLALQKEKVSIAAQKGDAADVDVAQDEYTNLIAERRQVEEEFFREKAKREKDLQLLSQQTGLAVEKMGKDSGLILESLREEYDKTTLSARQYFIQSLQSKGVKPEEQGALIQQFDITERVTAQKKATEEVEAYIQKIDQAKEHSLSFGDVSNTVFSGQLSAISKLGDAFSRLITNIENTNLAMQTNSDMMLKNAEEVDPVKRHLKENELLEDKARLEKQATKQEIAGLSQIAGAAASMFNKKSAAAKALHGIEMALAAARMVMQAKEIASTLTKTAVDVASGAGKMFSQSGWLGFAGVAAMLAVMAGLGFASSGGSNNYIPDSPESGTVLGDKSAKSESATNIGKILLDIHASEYIELRGINTGVQNFSRGISTWVTQFFQSGGLKNWSAEKFMSAGIRTQIDPIGKKLENMLMGVPKIVAQGIMISSQPLQNIMNGLTLKAKEFADIERKGLFSSSKTTVFAPLNLMLVKGLTNIFSSARDVIKNASTFFGKDIEDALTNYILPKLKINLKGLNAEKASKKISNVLSTALDKMTKTLMGDVLLKYQQLGEGLYETMVRLEAQTVVAKSFFKDINSVVVLDNKQMADFSQTLVDLLPATGSASEKLKAFQQTLADFYKTFAPEKVQKLKAFSALGNDLGLAFSKAAPTRKNAITSNFNAAVAGADNLSEAIFNFVATLDKQDAEVIASMLSLSDAAKQAIKDYDDARKIITDQIQSLTDSVDTRSIQELMETLSNTSDINNQRSLVVLLQKKIMDNYNTQLNGIKSIKSAFVSLADTVKKLLLGDLSTLGPKQKLDEAQKQYTDLLIASKSTDAATAADAASKLGNAAEEYLREAKSYYGSTATYAAIFDSVTATLSALSISAQDSNQQIIDATKSLADAAIQQLSELANTFKDAFITSLHTLINTDTGANPPTENTFLKELYKQYADAVITPGKKDDKAKLREISAYNLGGMELYNAVISGDTDAIKAIASAGKVTLKNDEALLKAKQALIPSTTNIDDLIALQQEIETLKNKIKQDKLLVKFKADGGVTSGLTLVGERGPELLNLPGNTKVINNTNTQRMLTAQGKEQYNVLTDIKNELTRLNNRMETIERKTRLATT